MTSSSSPESAEVVVVGAGPSGLAAATALRRAGAGRVVVLEREAEAGGIPRHARHQGFGMRDLRRALPGPDYAARIARAAVVAGAELRADTQATGWTRDGALQITSPQGRSQIRARAVVLATGCRERPRAARLVAGSRPAGVMSAGMLQQLVYLQGARPGRRAVIVGAEHVSFSALATLAHGGGRAVAMTTELSRHQTLAAFRAGAALRFRVPLLTRTAVTAIHGRSRVEWVELTDLDTGEARGLACDLVVFTADWIPDHELACSAGVALDPGTRGPQVDLDLRTTREGVFAAGNLLHGAEQADVAALSGRRAAVSVLRYLAGEPWPARRIDLLCAAPLHWITPNALSIPAGGQPPARRRFSLRARGPAVAAHRAVARRPNAVGRLPAPGDAGPLSAPPVGLGLAR
jgi:thioredoxin reductase